MLKINGFALAFRLLPALIDAIDEIVEAVDPDSPGGKKIVAEEWDDIGEAILDHIRDPLRKELRRAARKARRSS